MTSSRRVAPEEVPEYPGPIGSAASTLPLLDGQHQEIGGRKQQEDACCRIPDLNNVVAKLRPELGILARRAFYAVYDGFSGPFVSTWLARNLHEFIIKEPLFESDPLKAMELGFEAADLALAKVTKLVDEKVGSTTNMHQRIGSCATVALILNDQLFMASVGDCRAVLYRQKKLPLYVLTTDHKPNVPSEKERIEAAGAAIEQKTAEQPGCLCYPAKTVPIGPWRIKPGGLAVARAFGAGHAKRPELGGVTGCLIVKPDLKHVQLTNDDLCLLICSDGVWDNCSGEQLQSLIRTPIYDCIDFKICARYAANAAVSSSMKRSPDAAGQDNTSAVCVVINEKHRR